MLVITLGQSFSAPFSLPSRRRSHSVRRFAASQGHQTDPLLDWLRESGLPAQKVPKLLCIHCISNKDELNCVAFQRELGGAAVNLCLM